MFASGNTLLRQVTRRDPNKSTCCGCGLQACLQAVTPACRQAALLAVRHAGMPAIATSGTHLNLQDSGNAQCRERSPDSMRMHRYDRAKVWFKGKGQAGAPLHRHRGPDFDRMYCKLCGEFTEAFSSQVNSCRLFGLTANLHHWPLRDGLRIEVEGLNRRFCPAHLSRNRNRNGYASLQQVRRRQEPIRKTAMAMLALKYADLRHEQATERALSLCTSRSSASYFGRRQIEAIEQTTDSRTAFLDGLGIPADAIQQPSSLTSIHITRGRIAITTSSGEDMVHRGAGGSGLLREAETLAHRLAESGQWVIGNDWLLLDVPALRAYVRVHPGSVTLDFASVDMWPELEEVVADCQSRQLSLHAIQSAYKILST